MNLVWYLCYDKDMLKKDYRDLVLPLLKGLEPEVKRQKDLALLADFVESSAYQKAKTVATYLALPHEYDTEFLINQAQKDGKTILVPKAFPKGEMIFVSYQSTDVQRSSFGVLEPRSSLEVPKTAIDVVHVPGVVFNKKGYRIGYGGGYYDRYLADYDGDTISTIYDCQLRDFEAHAHDIAVKEIFCR